MAVLSNCISIHEAEELTIERKMHKATQWIQIKVDGIDINIHHNFNDSDTENIEYFFRMAQYAFHECYIERAIDVQPQE